MTKKQHVLHVVGVVVLSAAAGVVELCTTGSWAHFAWAGTLAGVIKYALAARAAGTTSPPPASP